VDAPPAVHAADVGAAAAGAARRRDFGAAHLSRPVCREFSTHARTHHRGQLQRGANDLGAEQSQAELNADVYHTEEVTERIESEDSDKPAVLKKKLAHKSVTGNPFVSARHEVTLRQNPRKKGSAFYDGYETDCAFAWKLRNPSAQPQKITLTFPLPAAGAVYDGLRRRSTAGMFCRKCRSRIPAWCWNAT